MVFSILAQDPFPSPRFGDIIAFRDSAGRQFFEFYDGILPLVLRYRVYRPDIEGQSGMVWISAAIPDEYTQTS
jgi:hypothetical protein